jgi:hypothetical protein
MAKTKTLFTAKQFTDTAFHSKEDKRKYANALAEFAIQGFPKKLFTTALYNNLRNSFGHIAHYDKDGFWTTWFQDNRHCDLWISHISTWDPMGDPAFTFSDMELAFKKWLLGSRVAKESAECSKQEIESEERAQLRALLKKYPDERKR